MGILLDSTVSRHTEENELLQNHSLGEFNEHPFLISIDNPINRFCDDFVSYLNEDLLKNDSKPETRLCVQEQISIDGYTVKGLIGVGAEAIVYEGIENETSTSVAIKVYKRVEHMGNGVPREVEISNRLDHPNIIKIQKCFEIQRQHENSFVGIMPLAPYGTFGDIIPESPVLTVSMAIEFLSQIGSVLDYMHSNNIIHHDIKPGNILIFENGFALSDFSVSVILNDEKQMLTDRFGTSFFIAPEISRNSYSPKPTDMWSLGITVYVLIFGKMPFNLSQLTEPSTLPEFMRVTDNVMPYELVFPDWPVIPNELKDIISGLLIKDPDQRMTAKELVSNPWMKEKNEEWNELMNFLQEKDEIIDSPISV